jgi:membrane-bound serine protease (ClpP class)
MTAIVLLFITGALLLAAEVMLPGGIAGIIGGAALLAGSVFAYLEFGLTVGSVATLAALLLVAAMLYAELIWLPRSKLGRAMVVDATIGGEPAPPPPANEVIGQVATALTTLAPSGVVSVGGKRYEAFCRTGLVERGTELTVVGVDNFRLIVSENRTP